MNRVFIDGINSINYTFETNTYTNDRDCYINIAFQSNESSYQPGSVSVQISYDGNTFITLGVYNNIPFTPGSPYGGIIVTPMGLVGIQKVRIFPTNLLDFNLIVTEYQKPMDLL